MGGKLSRTKGHAYERAIVIKFKKLFPEAIRQLEYQEGLGVDLANTGRLRIQCKRRKNYAPMSCLEEARDGKGIPVLVTKADRKESIVALPLVDFLAILEDPNYIYFEDENGKEAEGSRREESRREEDASEEDQSA